MGVADQILQGQPGLAPDVPALPDNPAAAVVEKTFPKVPGLQDKTGIVQGVIQAHHGAEIVAVGICPGILGQGGPIGQAVPVVTILEVGSRKHRQIAVACGIQKIGSPEKPHAVLPCGSHTGRAVICLPDAEGHRAQVYLHPGFHQKF